VVAAVEEDGPAAAAGLRPGDVVVRAGGRDVRSVEDVLSALRGRARGDRLAIVVARRGERRTLDVELGSRPG
jgi:serine protease Do